MWYVCSKLTPLWPDRTCLCFTTIISLSKTKFTVLAATFHLERLGASFTMNIKMQWKESEPMWLQSFVLYSCMNQVLAFTHRSGDADEPFGHAELLAQYIKEIQAIYCNGYIRHHAATAEFPGHETSPRALPRVPKLVHTLMLFASHHTSNLMISHILLFLTTLSRLGGGGHISSDWQQQQLRLRGVRTAADRQQMAPTYEPPISQSQSEPNAKIRKKQEWCKDTGELQKVTIFSADPEPSAARHGNTSLGCYAHYCSDLILDNTLF